MSTPSTRRALVLGLALAAAPAARADHDTLHVPGQFPNIQAALDAAHTGDLVLVADGTYEGPGNRDLTFLGKDLVLRSENGPEATIIDAGGTPTEPYRGLVFENGETRAALVEGFTITGGATLPGAVSDQFNGGAILIRSSSPTIRDCHFVANSSGCWGGAVYSGDTGPGNGPASPLIESCLFLDNVTDDDGGGFFTWGWSGNDSRPIVRNSVFAGNGAVVSGGAVTSFGGAHLTLENVTVVGNEASFGRGLYVGDATIRSSVVWGNGPDSLVIWGTAEVSYSDVEGGAAGPGNLDVAPLFAADGWHLGPASPLVDAGAPAASPGELDIDGQPRLLGERVDIGADESRALTRSRTSGPAVHP